MRLVKEDSGKAAQIRALPTPEDRSALRSVVSLFLHTQSGRARQIMLKSARAILDRYGVSKISFDDYIVHKTDVPGWAAIVGKEEITGRQCPGCGAEIYEWPGPVKILDIKEGRKYDEVTFGCRCGKIFMKKEAVM